MIWRCGGSGLEDKKCQIIIFKISWDKTRETGALFWASDLTITLHNNGISHIQVLTDEQWWWGGLSLAMKRTMFNIFACITYLFPHIISLSLNMIKIWSNLCTNGTGFAQVIHRHQTTGTFTTGPTATCMRSRVRKEGFLIQSVFLQYNIK